MANHWPLELTRCDPSAPTAPTLTVHTWGPGTLGKLPADAVGKTLTGVCLRFQSASQKKCLIKL